MITATMLLYFVCMTTVHYSPSLISPSFPKFLYTDVMGLSSAAVVERGSKGASESTTSSGEAESSSAKSLIVRGTVAAGANAEAEATRRTRDKSDRIMVERYKDVARVEEV